MRLAVAVAVALFATSAQADVVYNWQQLSASPSIESSSGRIVFTEAAYLAGRVDYRNGFSEDTNAPVRFFFLSSRQGSTTFGGGFSPGRDMLLSLSSLTLGDLLTGGFISGSQASTDVQVSLLGQGSTWIVQETGQTGYSPPPSGCEFIDGGRNCTLRGAVGQFVLDRTTIPGGGGMGQVPLPGTLPLMALASFGLVGLFRLGGRPDAH